MRECRNRSPHAACPLGLPLHLVAQVESAVGFECADQVELDVLRWHVVEQPPALAQQHRAQLDLDHVEDRRRGR